MLKRKQKRKLVIFASVLGLCLATTVLRPALEQLLNPLPPSPVLSDVHLEELSQIDEQLEEIRGLPTNPNVTVSLYSRPELGQMITEDMSLVFRPIDAQNDAVTLWSLGLMDWKIDLVQAYSDLYSYGIAGIYRNWNAEILLTVEGEVSAQEYLAYAHESAHAMQDLSFDLKHKVACLNDDTCLAIHSIVEGEASLLEALWLEQFASNAFREQLEKDLGEIDKTRLDNIPDFLRRDFTFPYTYGYEFVRTVYEAGGWEAVNALHFNPPVSTEQIWHFDRFPNDQPKTVELPTLELVFDKHWTLLAEGILGEWYTFLILAHGMDPDARLPEEEAGIAAEGWGGDYYRLYMPRFGLEPILIVQHLWDTQHDVIEFTEAFKKYATLRFGDPVVEDDGQMTWQSPEGLFSIFFYDGGTTWIMAPDERITQSVWKRVKPD